MNGLIKQTSLDSINFFGSLAIAISGVALMLYVMTNGIGGGIAGEVIGHAPRSVRRCIAHGAAA